MSKSSNKIVLIGMRSKERLNTRNDTKIEAQLESLIKQLSNRITSSINNLSDWKFILVDGFLLYWDMQVVKELDIKLFIQADYTTLKKRREERAGYVTVDGRLVTIDKLVVLNSNCVRDIYTNLEMAAENVLEFVKSNKVCGMLEENKGK
ncbi:22056_t:CDS:2 [Gigaspora margarita]|uniref:22056_t:CDS:1 n=1 Tax=Gigaspora margarita TaxID=4874 RepID=A0ABN7UZA9_GIGMA|nr:22056_t:CDS:2 [Gigaspora margarita]